MNWSVKAILSWANTRISLVSMRRGHTNNEAHGVRHPRCFHTGRLACARTVKCHSRCSGSDPESAECASQRTIAAVRNNVSQTTGCWKHGTLQKVAKLRVERKLIYCSKCRGRQVQYLAGDLRGIAKAPGGRQGPVRGRIQRSLCNNR